MEEYRHRLARAMAHANLSEAALVERLNVSRQAVTKALKGGKDGRGAMSARNNALVARVTGVDADWLATGEGEMLSTRAWPFEKLTPAQWGGISPEVRRSSEAGLLSAVRHPVTEAERRMHAQVEAHYEKLIDTDPDGTTGNTESGGLDVLTEPATTSSVKKPSDYKNKSVVPAGQARRRHG